MNKIFLTLALTLLLSQNSYANIDNNQRVMAGFSISGGKSNFYIALEEKEAYSNDIQQIKLNLHSYNNADAMHYSGYRNVEGFENTKDKQDKAFASNIIGAGALTILAGIAGIVAIASAISN